MLIGVAGSVLHPADACNRAAGSCSARPRRPEVGPRPGAECQRAPGSSGAAVGQRGLGVAAPHRYRVPLSQQPQHRPRPPLLQPSLAAACLRRLLFSAAALCQLLLGRASTASLPPTRAHPQNNPASPGGTHKLQPCSRSSSLKTSRRRCALNAEHSAHTLAALQLVPCCAAKTCFRLGARCAWAALAWPLAQQAICQCNTCAWLARQLLSRQSNALGSHDNKILACIPGFNLTTRHPLVLQTLPLLTVPPWKGPPAAAEAEVGAEAGAGTGRSGGSAAGGKAGERQQRQAGKGICFHTMSMIPSLHRIAWGNAWSL